MEGRNALKSLGFSFERTRKGVIGTKTQGAWDLGGIHMERPRRQLVNLLLPHTECFQRAFQGEVFHRFSYGIVRSYPVDLASDLSPDLRS